MTNSWSHISKIARTCIQCEYKMTCFSKFMATQRRPPKQRSLIYKIFGNQKCHTKFQKKHCMQVTHPVSVYNEPQMKSKNMTVLQNQSLD